MKEYSVTIEVKYTRQYEVSAENEHEAVEKALDQNCRDFSSPDEFEVLDVSER